MKHLSRLAFLAHGTSISTGRGLSRYKLQGRKTSKETARCGAPCVYLGRQMFYLRKADHITM